MDIDGTSAGWGKAVYSQHFRTPKGATKRSRRSHGRTVALDPDPRKRECWLPKIPCFHLDRVQVQVADVDVAGPRILHRPFDPCEGRKCRTLCAMARRSCPLTSRHVIVGFGSSRRSSIDKAIWTFPCGTRSVRHLGALATNCCGTRESDSVGFGPIVTATLPPGCTTHMHRRLTRRQLKPGAAQSTSLSDGSNLGTLIREAPSRS